jgi:hypothetical protein
LSPAVWAQVGNKIHPPREAQLNDTRATYGDTRIAKGLDCLSIQAPSAGIIIGFREHQSWLQAAFSQKAKRRKDLNTKD